MEKILVFAGTIEGRKIAEFLNDHGIYGEDIEEILFFCLDFFIF